MKRKKTALNKFTAMIMVPVITVPLIFFTGCGKKDDNVSYDGYEDYSNDAENEYYDGASEEGGYDSEDFFGGADPVEAIKNRPQNYETENTIEDLDAYDEPPVEISIENFCDGSAVYEADENGTMDHLLWLADYAVNCVQPQAVRKLLQLPVLAEAAENGEISRYISVYLTENNVNQFGAMEQTCYMGKDGHGVAEWDSPIYSIGHKMLINLDSFGPETRDDPEKQWYLESSMIHEMMHAFMSDYLFNLSFGTGRDGVRVIERDDDGDMVMEDEDVPLLTDVIPRWFQEGLAMTVEDGYGTRREEFRDLLSADAYTDEYLLLLSSPDAVSQSVNLEFDDGDIVNTAKITNEENTYTTGYVATMFLCSLAGEKLGYQAFDEYGTLNSEALFYGLNDLIVRIHDGNSLDSVIADISTDSSTGVPVYSDTSDFEEKCFSSAEDPGLVFMQKMFFDLEARAQKDPDSYIPCGSVLPGYVNEKQHCMDVTYHQPESVYQVDNINAGDPSADYFSISTIRMSDVAITGGRRTSYDQAEDALSQDEADERDSAFIGDTKEYIDISLEDD